MAHFRLINKHKIAFYVDCILTKIILFDRGKYKLINCLRLFTTLLILTPIIILSILISSIKNMLWWLAYDINKKLRK